MTACSWWWMRLATSGRTTSKRCAGQRDIAYLQYDAVVKRRQYCTLSLVSRATLLTPLRPGRQPYQLDLVLVAMLMLVMASRCIVRHPTNTEHAAVACGPRGIRTRGAYGPGGCFTCSCPSDVCLVGYYWLLIECWSVNIIPCPGRGHASGH